MNEQKTLMLTPALIGGVMAGFLSGVPLLSCLCCLWIIGGAMLASYLLVRDSSAPLTPSDGAIVGVFTGLVASVVQTVVSLLFLPLNRQVMQRIMERFAEYMQEMPSGFDSLLNESSMETSVPRILFGLVVYAIIFSALGALGGIIGLSLFKKKPPQPPQGDLHVPESPGNRQP